MALPWFRDLLKRLGHEGAKAYDCKTCMRTSTELIRMSRGCGYLPPADGRVRLSVWQPPASNGEVGYSGEELTTCPGYTTRLPEVTEVTIARVHWNKGNLAALGPQPEEMLDALVVSEGAHNQFNNWITTPSKDGGGGA